MVLSDDRTPIQPFDPNADHPTFSVIVVRWTRAGARLRWTPMVMHEGDWVPIGIETFTMTPAELKLDLELDEVEVHLVARPVEP